MANHLAALKGSVRTELNGQTLETEATYIGRSNADSLQLKHLLDPESASISLGPVERPAKSGGLPKLSGLDCRVLRIVQHCLDVPRSSCMNQSLVLFLH